MSQPTYIGSGTTPKMGDTKLILLTKILGAIQNNGGSSSANDPKRSDTVYRLRRKIVRARAGI